MARRAQTHNEPPSDKIAVDKEMAKVEFSRRLNAKMIDASMNQSDLARAMERKTGLKVGRDSISHYVRGDYLPTPSTLKAMADTLGCDPRDLLPAKGIPEAGEKLPPIGVQDMNDGTAWLRVNQAVKWPIAVKVLALLRGEE